MEGTVCHCHGSAYMWQHQKNNPLRQPNIVDIWVKDSTNFPEIMALVGLFYFCAAHYHEPR